MIEETKIGQKLNWNSFLGKQVIKVIKIHSSSSVQGKIIQGKYTSKKGTFLFKYLSEIET